MSAPAHVDRCRQWLLEQIETMATLRTSNVRDLSFKSWRQNTVTAIQRIWPNDRERVERFRRVVFTPPHSKPDAKLTREWFGKGIGESRAYLQSLLETIEREGVPEDEDFEHDDRAHTMEDEVGFPMLDLDENAADEPAAGDDAADSPAPAGDLSVTSGYTSPDEQGATPHDPASPAPPSLSMRWRVPSLASLSRREMAAAPTPPALGESATRSRPLQDDRPTVQIPRAPSLQPAAASGDAPSEEAPADEPAEHAKPAAPVAPKAEAPAPAKPAAPIAPKAGAPAPAKPAAPVAPKAEAPAPAKPAAPIAPKAEAPTPSRESASRPASRAKNGRKGRRAAPKASPSRAMPKPKLKDMLGFDEFEARAGAEAAGEAAANRMPEALPPAMAAKAEALAPAKPAARAPERVAAPEPEPAPAVAGPEPAPVEALAPTPEPEPEPEPAQAFEPEPEPAPDEEEPEDGEGVGPEADAEFEADRARATVDFLLNSPVFGAVGRPVQRRTDTTEFLDPDAVALATYAVDLGRLGVPEAMRVSLAARLIDVARHIENGELDWALLRASVTDAMQYPQLARRLLPVLLPWLERAA